MNDIHALSARRIHITGVVQGVGFRPFVYNLATQLDLVGWVLNSSAGVEIETVGSPAAMDQFVERLRTDAPPLARIEQVTVTDLEVDQVELPAETRFAIRHSQARAGEFQPISPDIAVCEDCLREMFDPQDRRYRYPFINCTNCGPRFTIIRDIPYDRPKTTMAPFPMCPDCQREYDDPTDRRFHAQPNACPVCGPRVWFQAGEGAAPSAFDEQAVQAAREALMAGEVVAVKGLGGFHLACDATNDRAVALLRERKGRVDKPFALMCFDLGTVEAWCEVGEEEAELLTSIQRPIVLLRRRSDGDDVISPLVAPGNVTLGVMLPYTPLHYLLLQPAEGFPQALVMTSGNYSEEPIATHNQEALERLARLADGFLLHDREIHARCDDSVTRVLDGEELPVRRSRGYAPYPVHLPFPIRQVLAVGGEMKNTFCLTRDRYAFLSQHIGDMENYETLCFFEHMAEQLARTFRIRPEAIACDLHPGYLSTRWALSRVAGEQVCDPEPDGAQAGAEEPVIPYESLGEPTRVQHHHAHVAACLAENGVQGEEPVIGVTFDGTGYGDDGAIWGGEFLIGGYTGYRRAAHLKYVPLPGGDEAIRRPYRTALAHLWAAGVDWDQDLPPVAAASAAERRVLRQQLERGLNTVPTSSVGRLYDAVAALAGVRQEINYEAQAAIELEALVDVEEQAGYRPGLEGGEIDPAPVIWAVVADVRAGVPAGRIAARFHNGLAHMIRDVCIRLREETGLNQVVLSGGVFQNVTLLGKSTGLLRSAGFTLYLHHLVPPNDACTALGQAIVAGWIPEKERDSS